MSMTDDTNNYMDFSISSNRVNHWKPIHMYIYTGVKSNLETEICSNIYFNSVFWNIFISLKSETEHEYYNTIP